MLSNTTSIQVGNDHDDGLFVDPHDHDDYDGGEHDDDDDDDDDVDDDDDDDDEGDKDDKLCPCQAAWSRLNHKFDLMYAKRAFVHW